MPILAAVMLVALGAPYTGTIQDAKKSAESVAGAFLRRVDAGKTDDEWKDAAPLLKKTLTREQWRLSIEGLRAGVGNIDGRTWVQSAFTEIVPNVPPGAYAHSE